MNAMEISHISEELEQQESALSSASDSSPNTSHFLDSLLKKEISHQLNSPSPSMFSSSTEESGDLLVDNSLLALISPPTLAPQKRVTRKRKFDQGFIRFGEHTA